MSWRVERDEGLVAQEVRQVRLDDAVARAADNLCAVDSQRLQVQSPFLQEVRQLLVLLLGSFDIGGE